MENEPLKKYVVDGVAQRMRSSSSCATQAWQFMRMRGAELPGDAARVQNGEFLLSFCGDFRVVSGRIIAVCAADMLSRSRCLTRSVGRSIVALRQVCSYSAHVNVPVGKPRRWSCSWTQSSHAKLNVLGLYPKPVSFRHLVLYMCHMELVFQCQCSAHV